MKRLMIVAGVAVAAFAHADEQKPAVAEQKADEAGQAPVQLEEKDDSFPIWGFGNYGFYSGYQLYGSLVNKEPTLQGYAEINFNIPAELGYLGVGVWSNTDLNRRRRDLYDKWFNEWDPNIHWGKTFWFDDDETWGLDYRTEVVWYYYPHGRGHDYNSWGNGHFQYGRTTMTTMDWNHAFELKNPYVTPYFKWVHEYHENKANLFLGGLKKTVSVTKEFSITPLAELVYRSHRYNWCFPTAGWTELHGSGMASLRLGADLNYQITDNFGVFAKAYWCHLWDDSLRDAADHGSGGDYGQLKDFAWGAMGVSFNF